MLRHDDTVRTALERHSLRHRAAPECAAACGTAVTAPHTSAPVLWHFTVSHYNEKARWALDFKRVRHLRSFPVNAGSGGGAIFPCGPRRFRSANLISPPWRFGV